MLHINGDWIKRDLVSFYVLKKIRIGGGTMYKYPEEVFILKDGIRKTMLTWSWQQRNSINVHIMTENFGGWMWMQLHYAFYSARIGMVQLQ